MDQTCILADDIDDVVVGTYSMKCNDSYTLRIIFEIIASINTGGVSILKFGEEGLSCVAATGTKKVLIVSTFRSKRLLHYQQCGQNLGRPVEAYLKFSDMVGILKSYNRKDIIHIKISYNAEGRVINMLLFNEIGLNSVDTITPLASFSQEMYTNLYEEYYHDKQPTVNITAYDFSQIITKLKTRKCTKMEFESVHDGILIKGHHQGVIITGYHIQNNSEVTSNEENQPVKEQSIRSGGIILNVINSNCVAINLESNIAWISKISKACANNSVINIYLRENAPLVIGTFSGVMGETYYGFTHCDL